MGRVHNLAGVVVEVHGIGLWMVAIFSLETGSPSEADTEEGERSGELKRRKIGKSSVEWKCRRSSWQY